MKIPNKNIPKNKPDTEPVEENKNNPGLDADNSSAKKGKFAYFNSDNDRIKGNPDGENDTDFDANDTDHSPLLDK